MVAIRVVALAMLVATGTAAASPLADPVPPAPPIRDEAPVVVSGTLPGPGLWQVSHEGHVMYVLGTVSPLPRRLDWVSRQVEYVLAQSGEVVMAPGYQVSADLGLFGKISLLPSLIGMRRNPDGKPLQEMVSAESYARWLVLKKRYLGHDGGVEKMRPVFAAMELYNAAIDDAGLTGKRIVSPVIDAAVKAHTIKRTDPVVKNKVRDPKAALKEFRAESLSDAECFDKMVSNLEADVGRMAARANAWATGDIAALRQLPLGDQYQACERALTGAEVARRNGMGNVEGEMRQAWLEAAEAAIAAHPVSFGVLPMSNLLAGDGYLESLRAKGYEVVAPDAASADADATP